MIIVVIMGIISMIVGALLATLRNTKVAITLLVVFCVIVFAVVYLIA